MLPGAARLPHTRICIQVLSVCSFLSTATPVCDGREFRWLMNFELQFHLNPLFVLPVLLGHDRQLRRRRGYNATKL